ncbi:MAG: phosphoribosylformylglycinamidine cyclo-ligase [Firmicutes bacterium]|nr:phosphoribosylformylglycinamidine cyclo-ligase [Bacillota bacterium]
MNERSHYRSAGVDVTAGEEAVRRIQPWAQHTFRPEVIGGLGGFAGLFRLPQGVTDPVLVAGCDGVGTKLAIAEALGSWETVGIDLVAMCVNDIVTVGAQPLFFLDYIATGRLDPEAIERVVASMSRALSQIQTALLGGEMAEMPGFYPVGRMDLAGFAVGVVARDQILDGSAVQPGDWLIGLPSSGLHANGYALVRRILVEQGLRYDDVVPGIGLLGEVLLTPTRLYVHALQEALRIGGVHAAAHLTGGGWQGNLPRVLPQNCCAHVQRTAWEVPQLFWKLSEWGGINTEEMFATFNMGIGMVLLVDAQAAEAIMVRLADSGEEPVMLGQVEKGPRGIRWEE